MRDYDLYRCCDHCMVDPMGDCADQGEHVFACPEGCEEGTTLLPVELDHAPSYEPGKQA